jgi:hypothetical protein
MNARCLLRLIGVLAAAGAVIILIRPIHAD